MSTSVRFLKGILHRFQPVASDVDLQDAKDAKQYKYGTTKERMSPSIMSFLRLLGFTPTEAPSKKTAQLQPAVTAHVSLARLATVHKIGHCVPQNHSARCLIVCSHLHQRTCGAGFFCWVGMHICTSKQGQAGKGGGHVRACACMCAPLPRLPLLACADVHANPTKNPAPPVL